MRNRRERYRRESQSKSMLRGFYRMFVLLACLFVLGAFVASQSDSQLLNGRAFYKQLAIQFAGESYGKAATPLVMLMLPLAVVTPVAAVVAVQTPPKWFPNFTANPAFRYSRWWVLYWAAQLLYLLEAYVRHAKKQSGYKLLGGTANSFAILALLNLALFLIPVSRHNPLLLALDVPAEVAVQFHRVTGRVSIGGALIHGALYMTKWLLQSENLFTMLLPPLRCFTGGADAESGVECKNHECDCYDLLINFTGLIAAACFLGILLSSFEWLRRQHYRVFYVCHLGFASVGCAFAVVHWGRLLLYVLPAIVFHSLSVGLCLWEHLLNRRIAADGTTVAIRPVCGARDVYRLSVDLHCLGPRPAAGQWVRLLDLDSDSWIPLSHPISVCYVGEPQTDSDQDSLACFIRASGPSLRGLCNSENVRCMVEGFHGPTSRLEECCTFSHVILIAGGLGITPMISTLQSLCSDGTAFTVQTVELVWACRDAGLVNELCPTIEAVLNQSQAPQSVEFSVRIHLTGVAEASTGEPDEEHGEGAVASSKASTATEEQVEGAVRTAPNGSNGSATEPLKASSFMVQGCGVSRRVAIALCYSLAMVVSSWVALVFYSHVQESASITTRLYTLATVYAGCVVWCLPCVGVLRHLQRIEYTKRALIHDSEHPDEAKPVMELERTSTTRGDSVVQHAGSTCVELLSGRPDLESLVGNKDARHNVGVWVCGPEQLKASVRAAIGATATTPCNGRVCSKVRVYEETFEW